MTDREEFEEWWRKELPDNGYSQSDYDYAWDIWQACAERKNAIIKKQAEEIETLKIEVAVQSKWGPMWVEKYAQCEQQAKEIESLRGFAKECLDGMPITAERHGLIDKNGDPTPLLTGEK